MSSIDGLGGTVQHAVGKLPISKSDNEWDRKHLVPLAKFTSSEDTALRSRPIYPDFECGHRRAPRNGLRGKLVC